MTSKKIELKLSDGTKLVSWAENYDGYKQIVVGIEDDNGELVRDVVIVGEKYHYEENTDGPVPESGCNVWVFEKEDEPMIMEIK